MQTFLVGGAVRDKLLGLDSQDRDWVVVGADIDTMLAAGFQSVGKDFPVFLHPKTQEEYALARTERKTGQGYHGFTCHTGTDVTLEQDLIRRDLTINAMAEDQNGNIIDPYAGQQDLQNKMLRHVSPAFVEDPLRVLRVARFHARYAHLGFSIAPETLALMQQLADSGELNNLIAERVWQETHKALTEKSPDIYFQSLRDCGALKVIFPELDNLFGIPNPPQWHPEIDSGIHSIMVLQQAALLTTDPEVRFAAVCHDFGKATTAKEKWPSHYGHEKAGVPIIKDFCSRFKIPNSYKVLACLVSEHHIKCHTIEQLKPQTLYKLLKSLDAQRRPERFKQFLLACEADARGRTGFENRDYPQAEFLAQIKQAMLSIDNKKIIQEGMDKQQIAKAIQQAQVQAITKKKQELIQNS